MRIHEAAQTVGCTQRAIKFYEEKGLIQPVTRTENGYRAYSDDDIKTLHTIQAYRKLGIGISDIKLLLAGENKSLLTDILSQKRREAAAKHDEIAALEAFIASGDPAQFDESIEYESIAQAMHAQFPCFLGKYLSRHFAPHLNIHIHTEEQKAAYACILSFWDNPELRLPFLYRFFAAISARLSPVTPEALEEKIKSMLNPSDEDYILIRDQTAKAVRMRENPLIRYSLPEIFKRRMMRSLRDCGYYDIFIPQMKRLSPSYQAYHDALDALNTRICNDLNLYYDSKYNLVRKK